MGRKGRSVWKRFNGFNRFSGPSGPDAICRGARPPR
jgi:hypothetical protein